MCRFLSASQMHRSDRPGAWIPVYLPLLPQFGEWVSSEPSDTRCQPLFRDRINAFSSLSSERSPSLAEL